MVQTDVPGLLAIRHAVESASNDPITDAGIMAILRGDGGVPSHVRAVFGDVSLASILSVGASAVFRRRRFSRLTARARDNVAAANPELDAALKQDW